MRRAYIFLYDNKTGSRDKLKDIFDSMQTVNTWRFDIPNCFYIISEHTSQQLYEEFIQKNGTNGRFMFMEANDNRYGMMLPDTWYLLTNKYHKASK